MAKRTEKHPKVNQKPTEIWKDNYIQFTRLLAEITSTVDLSVTNIESLCETMGIDSGQLDELCDRAEVEWQRIKETGKCNRVTADWEL
jgi:hypothetical protein